MAARHYTYILPVVPLLETRLECFTSEQERILETGLRVDLVKELDFRGFEETGLTTQPVRRFVNVPVGQNQPEAIC